MQAREEALVRTRDMLMQFNSDIDCAISRWGAMYCLGDDEDGAMPVIETMSEDELPPPQVIALLGGDLARIFQSADQTDVMLDDLVAQLMMTSEEDDEDDM